MKIKKAKISDYENDFYKVDNKWYACIRMSILTKFPHAEHGNIALQDSFCVAYRELTESEIKLVELRKRQQDNVDSFYNNKNGDIRDYIIFYDDKDLE